MKNKKLKNSKLQIFDIPIKRIVESPENPNEMLDSTFDELVEGIRDEGFDEPCHVVEQLDEKGNATGKYIMVSGHHRRKAAQVLKMKAIPCVIKVGWDEDKRQIALVRRNMLRGDLNPEKFSALWKKLDGKYDSAVLQKLMGFTKKDAFKKLIDQTAKSLPAKQRKKFEEAKETITSVDDLSSVLNTIFKKGGSDLDHGFLVFSFGGKTHHYFKTDKKLDKLLARFEERIQETGASAIELFSDMLKTSDHLVKRKNSRSKSIKRKNSKDGNTKKRSGRSKKT